MEQFLKYIKQIGSSREFSQVNDKPSYVILSVSEGSQEILRAKALRMTLWDIHSNDNSRNIHSNDNVFYALSIV